MHLESWRGKFRMFVVSGDDVDAVWEFGSSQVDVEERCVVFHQ